MQILPHTLDRYRLRGIVSGLLANILAGVYRFHEMFFRTVAQNKTHSKEATSTMPCEA